MSPFFIEEFQKSHQCRACTQRRQENRKFCERHLAKARRYWANWTRDRQGLGKCISCNRNHVPGQQRCNPHRALNSDNCKIWYRLNRLRKSRYDRERRLSFLARGLCPQCGGNRPVLEGRNRCADCTLYMSQYR